MRKTIFVTGANGGLGQGIVKYFLDKNYNVIAVVRPGKAMPLHEDLTIFESEIDNEEDVVQLFNKIAHNKISIDAGLLVAGGFAIKSFLETSLEDLQSMMNKNFYTSFFVAKHLVRHWKDNNESGKIIFTGAKAALEKGGEATAAYSLSKSVLVKLVEIINEIAKSNVSASMVAPSIIDTPANRKAMPNANFEDWVKPEEIAHQMEFIINDPDVMAEVFIKAYKNS